MSSDSDSALSLTRAQVQALLRVPRSAGWLSDPLPTTKASPNPSRVAMIPTSLPAPNYPILVHFLENINYPLGCTKLRFFLSRLWVPTGRVLSLWSPAVVSRGRAPERSPNTVYVAAGEAENIAGAPQGLSLSRWERDLTRFLPPQAGPGRGGRSGRAPGGHRRARAVPARASPPGQSGHQPPPRGREACGRSLPRHQVERKGEGLGDGRPPKPVQGVGLHPTTLATVKASCPPWELWTSWRCMLRSASPNAAAPSLAQVLLPLLFLNTRSPPSTCFSQYPFLLLVSDIFSKRGALLPQLGFLPPWDRTHTALSLQGTEFPLS